MQFRIMNRPILKLVQTLFYNFSFFMQVISQTILDSGVVTKRIDGEVTDGCNMMGVTFGFLTPCVKLNGCDELSTVVTFPIRLNYDSCL